jgi:hypothetical protein
MSHPVRTKERYTLIYASTSFFNFKP